MFSDLVMSRQNFGTCFIKIFKTKAVRSTIKFCYPNIIFIIPGLVGLVVQALDSEIQ